MDWSSFFLGFLAFPLAGVVVLAVFALSRKLRQGDGPLSGTGPRGSTLSFSPRLIGEIGEVIDGDSGPTAKAS